MKTCTRCKQEKHDTDFALQRKANDGLQPKCRACHAELYAAKAGQYRERYLANREQVLARHKERYKADPVASLNKSMRQHGVTLDWYEAALAAQGGGCAICGTDSPAPNARFSIDHDHKCCPGQYGCAICVRGLLCPRCNIAIGMLDDDPSKANAAHMYLSRSA